MSGAGPLLPCTGEHELGFEHYETTDPVSTDVSRPYSWDRDYVVHTSVFADGAKLVSFGAEGASPYELAYPCGCTGHRLVCGPGRPRSFGERLAGLLGRKKGTSL